MITPEESVGNRSLNKRVFESGSVKNHNFLEPSNISAGGGAGGYMGANAVQMARQAEAARLVKLITVHDITTMIITMMSLYY